MALNCARRLATEIRSSSRAILIDLVVASLAAASLSSNTVSWVESFCSNIVSWVESFCSNIVSWVESFCSNIVSWVESLCSNIVSWAESLCSRSSILWAAVRAAAAAAESAAAAAVAAARSCPSRAPILAAEDRFSSSSSFSTRRSFEIGQSPLPKIALYKIAKY
jgi:hypothetical protein